MSLAGGLNILQRGTVTLLIGATGFGFVTLGRQINNIRLQTQTENRRLEDLAAGFGTNNPEKVNFKSPALPSVTK
ncbi:hypothetical protein TrLO_g12292 [Triparma laevis f. longispina]|uniref:Uncharacterized protein n=1 Tax=Triparma laevis f. longispina TaxID=1714387 RepID=A0A9W7KZ11_9STRA|nr:hypothetical protein TrLO_g12292 [Triparma laevis f. longispina]